MRSPESRSAVTPGRRLRTRNSLRLVAVLVIGVVAAGVLSVAITFWTERPLRKAEEALDAGRPGLALELTEAFLRHHPDHGRAEAIRARALVATGRPERAIEIFERVGAAGVEDLHAWARALLLLGRWAAAHPVLEEVVRRDPDDADALHELAACYAHLGHYRKAIDTAAEFARRSGQEARGQLMIGTLHRDTGNERQAAEAYARVLELQPKADDLQVAPEEFLHAYGAVLLELGEPERAAELLGRSLAVRPTAVARSDLGRAYEQLGRPKEAEEAWHAALALDPSDAAAREGLAAAALRRGDAQAALTLLAPFAEQAAPPATAAYLLQRAYTAAGDAAAAKEWRERADVLREEERVRATVDRVLVEAPDSAWADALRAYRSAEAGRWEEAEALMTGVPLDDPFVTKLRAAIRERSELPPLTDLPISRF